MNITTALATAYIKVSKPVNRRGLYGFMRNINRLLPSAANRELSVRISPNTSFSFPAGDPYWLSVFVTGRPYEPEITALLRRLPEKPVLFLDCGANFGYWSVIASETMKTVAVEASVETFRWLALNNSQNHNRFTPINAAITDGGTDYVTFSTGGSHAGRSITDAGEALDRVEAITIDELVAAHGNSDGIIFVKLDVEGVEIQAFEGATETLGRPSVFLYEDHGRDLECAPTAYLLKKGRRVVMVAPDGSLIEIKSVEDARVAKKSKTVGYNFATFGNGLGL